MARIAIDVRGRRYEISCRDGEEERLALLGRQVDAKAAEVARAIGTASEARELLLTALLLADELDEARGAAAQARIEEAGRTQAAERLAGRIEALADRLENPAPNA